MMPYSFSENFYLKQYGLLLVTAPLMLIMFHHLPIDNVITTIGFHPKLEAMQHQGLLSLQISDQIQHTCAAIMVALLSAGLLTRKWHWVAVALSMICACLTVLILEELSSHSCPVELIEYGGQSTQYDLFSTVPLTPGPGECFPDQHAASAFSLMSLFFLVSPHHRVLGQCVIYGTVMLGIWMSWIQIINGMGFLSYSLWALWWVWLLEVMIYQLYCKFYYEHHTNLTYRIGR